MTKTRPGLPWHCWVFSLFVAWVYAMGIFDLVMMLSHNAEYYARHGYGPQVAAYFTGYPVGFLALWAVNLVLGLAAPILLLAGRRAAGWAALASGGADLLLIAGTALLRDRIGVLGWGVFTFDLFILALTALFAGYAFHMERRDQTD